MSFDPELVMGLDPELLAMAAEHRERQRLALAYVRRLRSRRPATAPAAEYRCDSGCLLLAVYPSTAGPVLYAPALRRSAKAGESLVMNYIRGADMDATNEDAHAWRTGERASLLAGEPWATGCRHLREVVIPAERILGDLATRRPGPQYPFILSSPLQ